MHRDSRPVIGLLAASIVESWAIRQWEGVAEAARGFDIDLVSYIGGVLRSERFEEQANIMYDVAAAGELDGLIVWSTAIGWSVTGQEMARFLSRFGSKPIVSMELPFSGIPCVLMDDYGGMRAVVDHLIEEHGRRRIAFIRGPKTHHGFEERYRAYRDSLASHDLAPDEKLVAFSSDDVNGQDAMRLLLGEGGLSFDAVVGANDMLALDARSVLSERGIRIPDDVAIAGFDNMPESLAASPPLSSADPPFAAMGRRAVQIIVDLLAGRQAPEITLMPVGLARRPSCGCAYSDLVDAKLSARAHAPSSSETAVGAGGADEGWALIAQALEGHGFGDEAGTMRGLWARFAAELFEEESRSFLPALELEIGRAAELRVDPTAWLKLLAVAQRACAPWVAALPYEARLRAMELWASAHAVAAETIQGLVARRNVSFDLRYSALRSLSERLGSVYEVDEQMEVISRQLGRMGISGCYISLYSRPEEPSGEARLVLAYNDSRRIALPPEGLAFPAPELVPPSVRPGARGLSLLALALYFGSDRLGFAVFETEGKEEALLCEVLRWQISGALKGAATIRDEKAAAAQKATLLKELQHRVKNSMSIIAGIASIEAKEASQPETRRALVRLEARIAAIGDLYEALYDSGGMGSVDLCDYLSRVVDSATQSIGAEAGKVAFDLSLERCEIDLKRAVSLGLIVNELVTDSLKHAFPGGRGGRIGLSLAKEADDLVLELRDDGVGFPDGFDPQTSGGFGLQMVRLMAQQIDGSLAFGESGIGGRGVRTSLRFSAKGARPIE